MSVIRRQNTDLSSRVDGTTYSFTKTKPVDRKSKAFKQWFELYKWFVYREASEVYAFHYDTGTIVFKKKDVKTIKFEEVDITV